MQNYKIKTKEKYDWFGKKQDFTDEQKQQLRNMRFCFKDFFNMYEMSMGNFINMIIIPSEKYLHFHYGRLHFLPCELDKYIKDKEIMKTIRGTVKTLKEIGII